MPENNKVNENSSSSYYSCIYGYRKASVLGVMNDFKHTTLSSLLF